MEIAQSLISFSLLIVEDDKAASDVISKMVALKFPKCTVHTAGNGIQGIELFKEWSPDLVLTDINMPVMEGLEMIREISLINANASFIVLTAYFDKITFENFKDLSVCAYLIKPLDLNELLSAIEECVAKTKPQGEQTCE
jgi:YesN/AraC family two-component response regulator